MIQTYYVKVNQEFNLFVNTFSYTTVNPNIPLLVKWEMRVDGEKKSTLIGAKSLIFYKLDKKYLGKKVFFTAYVSGHQEAWKNIFPEQMIVVHVEEEQQNVRIRTVKGTSTASVDDEVEYEATEYNIETRKVYESTKKNIKWDVQIDGKKNVLTIDGDPLKGEKIKFKIPIFWCGKEVIIMPYLNVSSESYSATTTINGIKFPILIGQSDRRPGKEESGSEARDMHCGDMTKEEIWRIFDEYRYVYDLTFNDTDFHFNRFKSMAKTLFSENDIKLFVPVFPEDLSQNCYISGKIPVIDKSGKRVYEYSKHSVDLESNIVSMINHFRNGGGTNYSNYNLTTAVMCHEDTIRFFNEIRNNFVKKIKEKKGYLQKVKLDAIVQPAYSSWTDKFQGLTISLNDTWAYDVQITDYQLNDDGSYAGKMKIVIYDHFGLDNLDVGFNKPARYFDGFFHWFVLQRWNGYNKKYKPFVTVIEKELSFKGKI